MKSRRTNGGKVSSSRASHLRRKFGITPDQYDQLLQQQGESCGVCGRHYRAFKTRLAVDHDHKTGELRGLLCIFCNRFVIGRHRDSSIFEKAYRYLSGPYTGWFVPPKKKKKKRRKARTRQLAG